MTKQVIEGRQVSTMRGCSQCCFPSPSNRQSPGEQALAARGPATAPTWGGGGAGSIIHKKTHIPKVSMPQISILVSANSLFGAGRWGWSRCPPGGGQPRELGQPPAGSCSCSHLPEGTRGLSPTGRCKPVSEPAHRPPAEALTRPCHPSRAGPPGRELAGRAGCPQASDSRTEREFRLEQPAWKPGSLERSC